MRIQLIASAFLCALACVATRFAIADEFGGDFFYVDLTDAYFPIPEDYVARLPQPGEKGRLIEFIPRDIGKAFGPGLTNSETTGTIYIRYAEVDSVEALFPTRKATEEDVVLLAGGTRINRYRVQLSGNDLEPAYLYVDRLVIDDFAGYMSSMNRGFALAIVEHIVWNN